MSLPWSLLPEEPCPCYAMSAFRREATTFPPSNISAAPTPAREGPAAQDQLPVAPLDPVTSRAQVLFVVPALTTPSRVPVSQVQLPSLPDMAHNSHGLRPPPGVASDPRSLSRGPPPPEGTGIRTPRGALPRIPPHSRAMVHPAPRQALPVAGARRGTVTVC